MTVRADIAELLHAGHSDTEIGRLVNKDRRSIARARARLGIEPGPPGRRAAASVDDLFWRRTETTADGHLVWAGHRNASGAPGLRHGGRLYSARRVAFRIGNGREPEGRVKAGCALTGCVHPAHVEDQSMRRQYAAIFGGTS